MMAVRRLAHGDTWQNTEACSATAYLNCERRECECQGRLPGAWHRVHDPSTKPVGSLRLSSLVAALTAG